MRERARFVLVSVVLGLLTAAAYAPTAGNDFVPGDDEPYVFGNDAVRSGFTVRGLVWAFTSFGYASNWHPLTWISHMLDVQFFGLDPGAHHLVSVALHAGAAALLVLALVRATGRLWGSAAVGLLFALHPLHVESVAWVAERKDVLSGFFFSLGLLSYVHHARRPSRGRWLLVSVFFACGLLSKPTLVTFPAVLLLLDYWPLGRLPRNPGDLEAGPRLRRCLLEKGPWLLMSVALAAVTALVQQGVGSGEILRPMSLAVRCGNALVAYGWYLMQALWPHGLAFSYQHPEGHRTALELASAAALLGTVSWWAVTRRVTHPYAFVGWCWYLGMLVPMIGLVQVGAQAWADRYTYLPFTGLFVFAIWAARRFLERGRRSVALGSSAAVLVLATFLTMTSRQALVWRNGETLFRRALSVDPGNATALVGLGTHFLRAGRLAESAPLFLEALRRRPSGPEAYIGLGLYYSRLGLTAQEAALYERGLEFSPANARLLYNLMLVYRDLGRHQEALNISRRLEAVKEGYRSRWYTGGFR